MMQGGKYMSGQWDEKSPVIAYFLHVEQIEIMKPNVFSP